MYVLNSFNNTNHLKNDRIFLNAMQPYKSDSRKNAFDLCSSPQQMINTKIIEEWTVQPELRKCFLLLLTFHVTGVESYMSSNSVNRVFQITMNQQKLRKKLKPKVNKPSLACW